MGEGGWAEEGEAREELGEAEAPFVRDMRDAGVVAGEHRAPEEAPLRAERLGDGDVQPVVEQHKLCMLGGVRAGPHEHVAWVWITVDPAPVEHLCGEKLDHRLHDLGGVAERLDARAVVEADAVDPFGSENTLSSVFGVDSGDVHAPGKAGLSGDEGGGTRGVVCLA